MFVVGIVGVLLIIASTFLYETRLRDSNTIIAEIESENRELASRLGDIQAAIDSIGIGLAGSSDAAGGIADGIDGVIAGLDESIRILGELVSLIEQIEKIISAGTIEIP